MRLRLISNGMNIQENIALFPYTYLKAGGPARFLVEIQTEDELREAVTWAQERQMQIAVLGAGSNVLVSDNGFDGLVIRMRLEKLVCKDAHVYAGVGVSMAQAAAFALRHNLSGFEWAIGIPGTVGGSVYGNAGCFGGEMEQVLECVRVLECKVPARHASRGEAGRQSARQTQLGEARPKGAAKCPPAMLREAKRAGKVVEFQNSDCKFGYRESVFKEHKHWIILGATLKLKRISDEEKKERQARVTQMMRERVAEQAIGERTMGSTFKGIPITNETLQLVRSHDERFQKNKDSCWVFENRRGMMSAGFLIEQADLKKKKISGMSVSSKHANFLINDGMATAEHAVMLIALIKERVHRKFGIMLEEEIQYLGF